MDSSFSVVSPATESAVGDNYFAGKDTGPLNAEKVTPTPRDGNSISQYLSMRRYLSSLAGAGYFFGLPMESSARRFGHPWNVAEPWRRCIPRMAVARLPHVIRFIRQRRAVAEHIVNSPRHIPVTVVYYCLRPLNRHLKRLLAAINGNDRETISVVSCWLIMRWSHSSATGGLAALQ